MVSMNQMALTITQMQEQSLDALHKVNRLEQRVYTLETVDAVDGFGSAFTNILVSGSANIEGTVYANTIFGGTASEDIALNPTGGGVAIGTTSTTDVFHVVEDSGNLNMRCEALDGRCNFVIESSGTNKFSRLILNQTSGRRYEAGLDESGDENFHIGNTSLSQKYITVDGANQYIGINQNTPEATLDVRGDGGNWFNCAYEDIGTAVVLASGANKIYYEAHVSYNDSYALATFGTGTIYQNLDVLYSNGSGTVFLQHHSGGSVRLYRTGTTGTFDASLRLHWI